MRTIAIAAALAASPAFAQTPPTSADAGLSLTIVEPDDQGRIGEIVHHNRITLGGGGQEFFEFETDRGVFILRLEETPNTDCQGTETAGCPDTLIVWEMPEGIYADMTETETPEGRASTIGLYLWRGM